jgi:outer membrane protein assembly factor BamE
MPASPLRVQRLALAFGACAALSACGAFDSMSHRVAGVVTPYRVEVVQGNFISKEQVAALKPGMTRQQVREVLGTPLVTSLFHADRWDYVFTLRREGVEPQQRKLAVFFQGQQFVRTEGDAMPSESEFVAALGVRRKLGTVPPLQASEESLKAFPRRSAPPEAPAAPPPLPANYPPLEPPAR